MPILPNATDAIHYAHRWAAGALGVPAPRPEGESVKQGGFDALPTPATPPMTFRYGGRPSSELLPCWEISWTAPVQTTPGVTDYTLGWRDPESGLRCTLELRTFTDFPPSSGWCVFKIPAARIPPSLKISRRSI